MICDTPSGIFHVPLEVGAHGLAPIGSSCPHAPITPTSMRNVSSIGKKCRLSRMMREFCKLFFIVFVFLLLLLFNFFDCKKTTVYRCFAHTPPFQNRASRNIPDTQVTQVCKSTFFFNTILCTLFFFTTISQNCYNTRQKTVSPPCFRPPLLYAKRPPVSPQAAFAFLLLLRSAIRYRPCGCSARSGGRPSGSVRTWCCYSSC